MKKLLSLAAFAGIVATTMAPALATTASGTVTVKWNVSASASITFDPEYTTSGAGAASTMATGATVNLASMANGGSGSCSGTGSSVTAGNNQANATINFGAISPDLVDYTGCASWNAAGAIISTNDTAGYTLAEAASAATGGETLCAIPNGFSWGATGSSSTLVAANAASARTTAASWALSGGATSTCASNLTYGGTGVTAAALGASATAYKASDNTQNPAYFGEDYALLVKPNTATTASDQIVVTYTVTPS